MPAYFDTGFCVRKPSWHREEFLADRPPADIAEARQWAGLEWEPVMSPVYNAAGDELTDFKTISRSDNGYVLNISRDSYEMISNQETFEIVEAVTKRGAYLDTAGSVRDGRQVWALAHLDEPISIPGDTSPVFPYVVMLTSHDGTAACKVLPTTVRVVCWNTFQLASSEGDRTGSQFVFRHTRKVRDRIEEAKAALSSVRNFAEKWRDENIQLAAMACNPAQVKEFILEFLPTPPPSVAMTSRQVDNLVMARQTLEFIHDRSATMEGIRGTAYGLVQAAGEYCDHYVTSRGADAYVSRTLLRPNPLKAKALKLAVAACK